MQLQQTSLFDLAHESVAAPALDTGVSTGQKYEGEDGSVLVTEHVEFEGNARYLTADELAELDALEQKTGKKRKRLGRMIYEFETADTLNNNRRIYPSKVVRSAIEDFSVRVKRNVVCGNLDHPSIFDPDSLIVKLSEAAVKVVEAEMIDDQNVRIVLDIADNEYGRQLVSVMDLGCNPGLSQRALAIWREPNEEEKKRHKIPDGEYVVVAEMLRLITYDVVSEAGFSGAHGAKVQESKQQEPVIMTLEELKKNHPDVYNQVVTECTTKFESGIQARIDEAVEAAKPSIVDEAVKPLNEQLETERGRADEAIESLKAVKPALIKLGIVNEKMTDQDAATKVAAAEAKCEGLQAQLDEQKKANETLAGQIQSFQAEQKRNESLTAVAEKYKTHPQLVKIVEYVDKAGVVEKDAAIAKADELVQILVGMGIKADEVAPVTNGNQPFARLTAEQICAQARGGLNPNPANPENSNHVNSKPANDAQSRAVAQMLTGFAPNLSAM